MSAQPTTTHPDEIPTIADAVTARDIAYNTLTAAGFAISPESEFAASCERGSAALTVLFGAFTGKKKQHVRLKVTVFAAPGGTGSVVRVSRGNSGMMAGGIGVARARTMHREYRDQVGMALPR